VHIGASTAEDMYIQSVYDAGTQNLNYIHFASRTASATADKGQFTFNVDGTDILDIDDGGLEVVGGIIATGNASVTGTLGVTGQATLTQTVIRNRLSSFSSGNWHAVDETEVFQLSDYGISGHFYGFVSVYAYPGSAACIFSINQHENTFSYNFMANSSSIYEIYDLGIGTWTTGTGTSNGTAGKINIGIQRSNASGGPKFYISNRYTLSIFHVRFDTN